MSVDTKKQVIKHNILLMLSALICGCSTITDKNFNSTLWIQTSSEYKANSIQIFNNAMEKLEVSISDKNWTAAIEQDNDYSLLPEAIVMDIDQTVLDNSRYQGELIIQGADFTNETWDNWISLRDASGVPGALSFIKQAKSRNVEIIFISNRECRSRKDNPSVCPQEMDTIENLKKLGITEIKPENILLKNEMTGWDSEKKSRRKYIAEKYRIIMLFGDDLGDFIPDVKKNISYQRRSALVSEYSDNWGRKWFIFSNPVYGSWLRVLDDPKMQYIRGY
ncbi:MAG: acid phosphatase [Gammaproteobacteria bacterium]|nr:MAG: acid phosphatase [Gammaproteobacteria bacterium]